MKCRKGLYFKDKVLCASIIVENRLARELHKAIEKSNFNC